MTHLDMIARLNEPHPVVPIAASRALDWARGDGKRDSSQIRVLGGRDRICWESLPAGGARSSSAADSPSAQPDSVRADGDEQVRSPSGEHGEC